MTPNSNRTLTGQIDQLLPQTQCRQCDYPRCRDYAEAIADGRADIDQCPPGGQISIDAIAELLHRPSKPLNPAYGRAEPRQVAVVIESQCIGCCLCIHACPVDCIVGAAKVMHTVIRQHCTGCQLCLPVCPTDCIALLPAADPASAQPGEKLSRWPAFTAAEVSRSRARTEHKLRRLAARKQPHADGQPGAATAARRRLMQLEIQAAVQRQAHKKRRPLEWEKAPPPTPQT